MQISFEPHCATANKAGPIRTHARSNNIHAGAEGENIYIYISFFKDRWVSVSTTGYERLRTIRQEVSDRTFSYSFVQTSRPNRYKSDVESVVIYTLYIYIYIHNDDS